MKLVELEPGDILHVRVGMDDLGGGQGPWIPGNPDLEETKKALEDLLPGVTVYATHQGVELGKVLRYERRTD